MKKIKVFTFAFIASLSAMALAFGVSCPIDSSSAYFTGKTTIDSATGKLLKEYKCPQGHTFWSIN